MRTFCLFACLLVLFAWSARVNAETRQTVGWVENVRLLPEDLLIEAKLDTGADNSSLNVPQLTEFLREAERWVRFEVTGSEGKTVIFERKVIRKTRIKRHNGPGRERLVVEMGICLGRCFRNTEVNLVDRSRFNYQLLIGRSFLCGPLVVDPAMKFTVEPLCPGADPQ